MQPAAAEIASETVAFQVIGLLFLWSFLLQALFSSFDLCCKIDWFLIQLGTKLPLYAFKKANKVVCENGSVGSEEEEPPLEFLDSLLLGEVNLTFC